MTESISVDRIIKTSKFEWKAPDGKIVPLFTSEVEGTISGQHVASFIVKQGGKPITQGWQGEADVKEYRGIKEYKPMRQTGSGGFGSGAPAQPAPPASGGQGMGGMGFCNKSATMAVSYAKDILVAHIEKGTPNVGMTELLVMADDIYDWIAKHS